MDETLKTQLRILKLSEIKPNFSELGRIHGYDRRTVKKYYDGYEGKPARHDKPSRLDEHRDLIIEKLGIKGAKLRSAYEVLIEKHPDVGTYSNFCKYVRAKGLKPGRIPPGHPRYETPPGKQAQADWKEGIKVANRHGETFTFNVFSYVLGNSRYKVFTYSTSRTRQDVIECLMSSFTATGGVPREILFDNMSSIVSFDGGRRKVDGRMKAFARDFGFRMRFCKPYHPSTKGKVEAANKFIDWIVPYEGEFESEDELIRILEGINRKANTRANGETGVPPVLLFQKEKDSLLPLPPREVMDSYLERDRLTTVRKDSLVTYGNSKYSVPPGYIGETVGIKVSGAELRIYHGGVMIASHEVSGRRINYEDSHYRELMRMSAGDGESVDALAERNLRLMDGLL